MADSKGTRSRKRKKAVPTAVQKAVPARKKAVPKAVPASRFLTFPEVKGKAIEKVELDPGAQAVVIVFQDDTVLSFDLDPGLSVFPELSERRRGNAHILKRWKPIHTPSSIVKWL